MPHRRRPRPRTPRIPAVVAAVLLLFLPGGVAGQGVEAGEDRETAPAAATGEDAPDPFGGTFLLVPGEGASLEEVVEEGVSLVKSWIKRPFAAGRIRETNRPYEWFQLFPMGGPDGTVRVSTPRWSLDVPRNGTLEWEREEDDVVRVTIEWTGEAWVQRYEAEDGVRVNRYALDEDGERLTLGVRITSDQLSGPLEYELVYRRR